MHYNADLLSTDYSFVKSKKNAYTVDSIFVNKPLVTCNIKYLQHFLFSIFRDTEDSIKCCAITLSQTMLSNNLDNAV